MRLGRLFKRNGCLAPARLPVFKPRVEPLVSLPLDICFCVEHQVFIASRRFADRLGPVRLVGFFLFVPRVAVPRLRQLMQTRRQHQFLRQVQGVEGFRERRRARLRLLKQAAAPPDVRFRRKFNAVRVAAAESAAVLQLVGVFDDQQPTPAADVTLALVTPGDGQVAGVAGDRVTRRQLSWRSYKPAEHFFNFEFIEELCAKEA